MTFLFAITEDKLSNIAELHYNIEMKVGLDSEWTQNGLRMDSEWP